MRFNVQQRDFCAALAHLSRVVDSKMFPNLKIEAVATDRILLTAIGPQGVNKIEVKVPAIDVQGKPVAVPCKKLYEIVSRLDGMLIFDKGELRQGKRKFDLKLFETSSFMPFRAIEEEAVIVDADDLISCLKGTIFAACKYGSAMAGVSIIKDEVCAMDGNMLGLNTLPEDIIKTQIIMPVDIAQEIIKCFSGKEISMVTNGVLVQVWSDDIRLESSLINGTYPLYKKLKPSKTKYNVLIDKAQMLKALELVSLAKNTNTSLGRLIFTENELTIMVNNADEAQAQDTLDIDFLDEPITIGVNIDYLTACIRASKSDVLTFRFNSPLEIILIESDDKNYTQFAPCQIR